MRLPKVGAWALAAAGMAGCGAPPPPAAAAAQASEVDRAAARRAYDAGLAAYDRGEHDDALAAFLVADDKVPSTEAIDAALLALPEANDADLRARFCDRLVGRSLGDRALERANETCSKVDRPLVRLRVDCETGADCTPTVAGRSIPPQTDVVVVATPQRVDVDSDGHRGSADIAPRIAEHVRIAARPVGGGISPAWFGTTLGVAAALGIGAGISAADVASRHDDFARAGCADAGSAPCETLAEEGRAAEQRTNILFGVALGGAAAAGILAVFTDFGGSGLDLVVNARAGGAGAWLGGRLE